MLIINRYILLTVFILVICLYFTNPTLEDYAKHIKLDIIQGSPKEFKNTSIIAATTMASSVSEVSTIKNYYLFSTFEFEAADLEIDLDGFPSRYLFLGIFKNIIYLQV